MKTEDKNPIEDLKRMLTILSNCSKIVIQYTDGDWNSRMKLYYSSKMDGVMIAAKILLVEDSFKEIKACYDALIQP